MWGSITLCTDEALTDEKLFVCSCSQFVYVVWEGQLKYKQQETHMMLVYMRILSRLSLWGFPHADTHPSALMKLEGGRDPAAPAQTRRSAHLQVLVISCLDYRKLLLPPDFCSPTHIQVETPVVHHLYGHRGVPFSLTLHVTIMSTSYQYQYTVLLLWCTEGPKWTKSVSRKAANGGSAVFLLLQTQQMWCFHFSPSKQMSPWVSHRTRSFLLASLSWETSVYVAGEDSRDFGGATNMSSPLPVNGLFTPANM